MTDPNPEQRRLIEETEGCYLVDAGPGTGKTFTITRRYEALLSKEDVTPDDVLLLTYTRNAAREMRDRVLERSDYPAHALIDAPISTFHALCWQLLRERGFDVPRHLGIDEPITPATTIREDRQLELRSFRTFLSQFRQRHPEHDAFLAVADDPNVLLDLINTLAAKGVVPTADGWYRDSKSYLTGDADAFQDAFDAYNRQDGNSQSPLRSTLSSYGRDVLYRNDAPAKTEIRGSAKTVPDHVASLAFESDRTDLFEFVHDLYFEYLEFVLEQNYLSHNLVQILAFVHLCEDDPVRNDRAYQYVMIDEFQDTNELQFKLALLLSATTNLCVVGDWKQSIYSFQHADVENIRSFRDRLDRFRTALNHDRDRVPTGSMPVETIELTRNYRSTQSIIDRSEAALVCPGSNRENLDTAAICEQIVSLEADTDRDSSRIEAIQHSDEHAAILSLVSEIVDNPEYAVRDDSGSTQPPRPGDIAIVSRTRQFARELLETGLDHNMPLAYDGDVELFRTDQAKLVLAWLRILEAGGDADRGWVVVLERAGYRIDEIEAMLEQERYPGDFRAFRDELAAAESVTTVVDLICRRYGYTGELAGALRSALQNVHDATHLTRGELISYIEDGIEAGTTHSVSWATGADTVTLTTIHGTKGLEYPIVILANMNRAQFPSTQSDSAPIHFDDVLGLRQRDVMATDHGGPHVYRNWRWDVLNACLDTDYDEERRLFYVALTRARDHLVVTAGDRPGPFFENVPIEKRLIDIDITVPEMDSTTQSTLDIPLPSTSGPRGMSPHDLMDTSVFESVTEGRGPAYGTKVHTFAEAYALGTATRDPEDTDERHVARFIDSLSGTPRVEEDVWLPIERDGERLMLHGYVDLVHITADAVEVIDYKTDYTDHAEQEYEVQLSVYYHVLTAAYPDRDVSAAIYYTHQDERETIDPLSIEALADRADADASQND